MLSISLKGSDIEKSELFLKAFGSKAEGCLKRSLNRSITGVRVDASKEARKHYNVKPAAIRKGFSANKAGGSLTATAVFKDKAIPLINFAARPNRPGGRRPAAGVSVKVKATRKTVRASFTARLESGHVGVYKREGQASFPIRELKSVAVPQMLNNPKVREQIQTNAEIRLSKTFNHEMNRVLSGGLK